MQWGLAGISKGSLLAKRISRTGKNNKRLPKCVCPYPPPFTLLGLLPPQCSHVGGCALDPHTPLPCTTRCSVWDCAPRLGFMRVRGLNQSRIARHPTANIASPDGHDLNKKKTNCARGSSPNFPRVRPCPLPPRSARAFLAWIVLLACCVCVKGLRCAACVMLALQQSPSLQERKEQKQVTPSSPVSPLFVFSSEASSVTSRNARVVIMPRAASPPRLVALIAAAAACITGCQGGWWARWSWCAPSESCLVRRHILPYFHICLLSR